jgi:hypothetical protein
MDLTNAIVNLAQSQIMAQVQFAAARKILDAGRSEGAAAVKLIEAGSGQAAQAGDNLASAAGNLGNSIDVYG